MENIFILFKKKIPGLLLHYQLNIINFFYNIYLSISKQISKIVANHSKSKVSNFIITTFEVQSIQEATNIIKTFKRFAKEEGFFEIGDKSAFVAPSPFNLDLHSKKLEGTRLFIGFTPDEFTQIFTLKISFSHSQRRDEIKDLLTKTLKIVSNEFSIKSLKGYIQVNFKSLLQKEFSEKNVKPISPIAILYHILYKQVDTFDMTNLYKIYKLI